jgi:outer membrane lipoprotein-sorting protein
MKKTINRSFLLLVSLMLLSSTIRAQTPEEKGLSIAQEADIRDVGYQDITANMLMILKNKHGQESNREMRIKTLEVEADGDKNLFVFDNPKDVKGTAFLSFTHKVGNDEQWMYLPALKRVKRISSQNKSGSFMGSEFSYEDMSNPEVEKYTYKWIRDEVYDGVDCFVIESYPVDKGNSGYTRMLRWIDKSEYRLLKVEFYDRKKSHLKTMTISGYNKYAGKHWRADELNMVNHQNGKSTQIEFSNYTFMSDLNDSDFTTNSLSRIK